MARKSYRGALPKPDSQGRWRPVVGRLRDGVPQRFYVGNKRDTTESEAQRRLDYIRDFYDRQCAEHGIDFWAGWAIPWALRLASGPIKVYSSDTAKGNAGQAAEEVSVVQRLQSWGVPVQIADPELQASGYKFLRTEIESQVNQAVKQALDKLGEAWGTDTIDSVRHAAIPQNLLEAETRTLHEALDAYRKHLEDTGKRDQDGNLASRVRKCRDRIGYLKEHHEDCPLWKLDLPLLQKMAAYWRNRPLTKRRTRCSWDHAHDMNKELFRFLDWLDNHPGYEWEKPKGTSDITRSPIKLPEDDPQEAFQTARKKTFTPEQLAILASHTDLFGRAIIGVCVNCAFGHRRSASGVRSSIRFTNLIPMRTKLGSRLRMPTPGLSVLDQRPACMGNTSFGLKLGMLVAPFLDGRTILPITNRGTAWYRTHCSNPQSKFNRWWSDLLERVVKATKQSDFPRYPFGSLRDLLPDILRREFSDEVASMCLQHGEIGEDDLLKCYANVPFKKLFEATRQLEQKFRPFLDVLKG